MIPVKQSWLTTLTLLGFSVFFAWWLVVRPQPSGHYDKQLFAAGYGAMAAWGGLWGLLIARKWGFASSVMGRSLIMFALGLFAQEFGQLSYSYYIYYLKIDVPYPSWGDLGYFSSILFYIYGTWLLARASGIHFSLKSVSNKIQAILIPAALFVGSYVLLLKEKQFNFTSPLTVFLDFGYPFGEAIYVSLALLTYLLTRKLLGGIMRNKILFILLALLIQYSADFSFLLQVKQETWSAGELNDLVYLGAYTVMTLALMRFATLEKSKN